MSKIWKARWLQDPRFDGLRPVNTFGRFLEREQVAERVIAEHQPGLSNIHMLLRRIFQLESVPSSAQLNITGDDYYKLWINGQFVGQGPAPGYHWKYFYNNWDIAPYLRAGENVIAVHVYYIGLLVRQWNSMDHRMGMICEANMTGQEGLKHGLLSDASWKHKIIGSPTNVTLEDHKRRRSPEEYYAPPHSGGIMAALAQFQENIDTRRIEDGWRNLGFDDAHWTSPSAHDIETKDYFFVPQSTPELEMYRVSPVSMEERGEGRYLLDFGREVVGYFGMTLPGKDGHIVEIRHAEELTKEGDARYQMRCSTTYQEFWTLSDKPFCTLEYFDYKGFRFVEVLDATAPLTGENCWATMRHYPYLDNSRFHSSHPLLNRIWDISVHAIKCCGQEVRVDCPTREKGHYLGDLLHYGEPHLLLTNDARMYRAALDLYSQSARISPGLMTVTPGNFISEIADFSLMFPLQLEFYYRQTGDAELVKELLPMAMGVVEYFRKFENKDGLLSDVNELWNLVDWDETMRDDYDFLLAPQLGKGPHAVLNLFYYGAVKHLSRLHQIAEQENQEWESRRSTLQTAIHHAFLQDSADAVQKQQAYFVDAIGSNHPSLHSNALALYFDLVPDFALPSVMRLLRRKRMACGPHMAYFLLHALFQKGETDFAFDLMTCSDDHSWAHMIDEGATAALEAWSINFKSNCTWCHSWAAFPPALLIQYVMGLQPLRPGWDGVLFAPQTPKDLDSACVEIAIPQGHLRTSFYREKKRVIYEITLPPDVALQVRPDLKILQHRSGNRYVLST